MQMALWPESFAKHNYAQVFYWHKSLTHTHTEDPTKIDITRNIAFEMWKFVSRLESIFVASHSYSSWNARMWICMAHGSKLTTHNVVLATSCTETQFNFPVFPHANEMPWIKTDEYAVMYSIIFSPSIVRHQTLVTLASCEPQGRR